MDDSEYMEKDERDLEDDVSPPQGKLWNPVIGFTNDEIEEWLREGES